MVLRGVAPQNLVMDSLGIKAVIAPATEGGNQTEQHMCPGRQPGPNRLAETRQKIDDIHGISPSTLEGATCTQLGGRLSQQ
jgi:hypothetical protein